MDETATSHIDDAVREMERTIYRAVEGALCVFERRTGLQPKEVEVVMCTYGPQEAPKYEIDAFYAICLRRDVRDLFDSRVST